MIPEVLIRQERDYLLVLAWGELSSETIQHPANLFRPLAEASTLHRQKRIMLDLRDLSGEWSAFDILKAGKDLAEHRRLGLRTAVLADPGRVTPNCFFETVAGNRGAAARVFTSERPARQWLYNMP